MCRFGHAGDQIGGARQRQRGGEAADDGDDLAFQSERIQGFIDRSPFETASRDQNVPAGRIASGRGPALGSERAPCAPRR